MLVNSWMTKKVITAEINDSIKVAADLLSRYSLRMLPVLEHKRLAGIVTGSSIRKAAVSVGGTMKSYNIEHFLSDIGVDTIIKKNPITVYYDATVEQAAEVLLDNSVSGVPVIDRYKELVGVISKSDLLRVLISLTGLKKGGIQFALQVKNQPGSIKEISEKIRKYGGRMASILTSFDDVPESYLKVYIRMYGIDRFKLSGLKNDLSKNAVLLYTIESPEVLKIDQVDRKVWSYDDRKFA